MSTKTGAAPAADLSGVKKAANALRRAEAGIATARVRFDAAVVAARAAGASAESIAAAARYSRQLITKSTKRFEDR